MSGQINHGSGTASASLKPRKSVRVVKKSEPLCIVDQLNHDANLNTLALRHQASEDPVPEEAESSNDSIEAIIIQERPMKEIV